MTAPLRAYGRGRARWLPLLLAGALLAPACGARVVPPLTPPAVVDARDRAVRQLQEDLGRLLETPVLARGHVGVSVASLTRGDVLFRFNQDRLLMPASNMKLVTLAVVAERLGWDFTFETTLHPMGPVTDGVLQGDLVVVGSGDPSFSTRDEAATRGTFEAWADTLRRAGIHRVAGRLVGDDRAFAHEAYGAGWAWDTLPWGYAAPIGALQVNENTVRLTLAPGPAPESPVLVTIENGEGDVQIEHHVVTGQAGSPVVLAARRRPGHDRVTIEGSVPLGSGALRRTLSIENPTLYFLRVLERTLAIRGIRVDGGVADVDDLLGGLANPLPPPLLVHRSPPLSEMALPLMKASQNLYAETLLRTVGRAPGTGAASEPGRVIVRDTLASWGVPADAVVVSDGSGLSRYNYATPDALLTVLRRMHGDARHQAPWLRALPIGGVDGTLERRFKGARAEGRVQAKTGTISNVRALSGYVDGADGERLAFVLLVNNTTAPAREIDLVTDAIVERLAAFSR